MGEKIPQKNHAIIRLLKTCANTCWLSSFQGAEVAFDVFGSTWGGQEGDTSHLLYEQIRCINMAYTYVHILQIHCCHLENCKSGSDICLRDGSWVCRKTVVMFLINLMAQETELRSG